MANDVVKREDQEMVYTVAGETVKLSPNTVRKYLVSGNPESVTMQEIVMFMNLCRYNGLNPWLKEAYCIKYGNSPATMVVGKEAYLKRAEANPAFDGLEAGIIVVGNDKVPENRIGTFHLDEETVVGGWARVWRKDRSHPVTVEVSFNEYAGRMKDGSLNSQWRTKPATMIRKVALVQALREAFPGDIGGMNVEEEANVASEATQNTEAPAIDPLAAQRVEEPVQSQDNFDAFEEMDIEELK